MVESPNYERLRELAELAYADQPDHAIYAQIQESLTELEHTIDGIRRNPGFIGEIRDSINTYLNERITTVRECARWAEYLHQEYTTARNLISQANTRFGELITHLNTPAETRAAQELRMVDFNGEVHMDQIEYNRALAEKRNKDREDASLVIINETNDALLGLLVGGPVPPVADPRQDDPGTGGGSGGGGGSVAATTGRRRSSSLPPSALIRPLPEHPAVPETDSAEDQPVYRSQLRWVPGPGGSIRPDDTPYIINPQWPRDALTHPVNAHLTPQGPIGGYLPPGIYIDDPRWSPTYHNPALGGPKPTTTAPTAAIINGVLTTTGAAAAGTGAGSVPTSTPNSLGPGGYPVGSLPPGVAPTHGGTLRPAGLPPANHPTTNPTTAARPYPGAWHAPQTKEDKDNNKPPRSLVGYDVTRVTPDPEPIDPSHFAAGDLTTLKPLPPNPDNNDRW